MNSRSGFSLIEVLVATAIMGSALFALFSAMVPALGMLKASKRIEEVRAVLSAGELLYPVCEVDDVEDWVVEEDESVAEAAGLERGSYLFSRTVDEKKLEENVPDDGLFLLRTRISWGEGLFEEFVRIVWRKDGGEYVP